MAEQNFRVRKGITVDGTGDSSIAGNLGIGVTAPTDTLAVRGGIKIGEFNDTDGTGYGGSAAPSSANTGTGAADPQLRVSGRTSAQPGIIQMAYFDANNFFGGANRFTLGKLQFAMNENSQEVTTVAEIQGVTDDGLQSTDSQSPGEFDGALTFLTSQGTGGSSGAANLTEKMILTGDGNLGIGTTSPTFPLHLYYTDNDTGPEGGHASGASGTIGASAQGGGLYIENASTTDGSYAGITFRTDTADARIAWQSVGSSLTNEGQMSFYCDTNDTDGGSPDAVFTLEEVLRLRGGSSDSDSNLAYNLAYINGRLGVGTASPSTTLDVAGTVEASQFRFNSNLRIGNPASNEIGIFTAATERMRFDASGNVGIGTTTPSTKLDVNGTVTATAFSGTVQPKATTAAAGNNTADYYAKLLTYNPDGGAAKDCNLILGVTSRDQGAVGSAIISVKFRSNGSTVQYGVDVAFMSKTGTSIFDQDAFQIFSDGNLVAQDNNTDIELWVKKNASYTALEVHEISKAKTSAGTLTYHTNSAWQSSAPTNNALTTTTQGIELNLDIVRVGVAGENTYMYLHPSVSNSLLYASSSGDVSLLADDDLTLHADDDMFFQAGGATKMTLLDNGNLGIGITSPGTKLHVAGGGNQDIKVDSTSDGRASLLLEGLKSSDATFAQIAATNDADSVASIAFNRVGADDAADIAFHTQTTSTTSVAERMRITSDGNVGIGTTSPAVKLQIAAGNNPASAALMSSSSLAISSNDGNLDLLSYDDNTTVANNIAFKRFVNSAGGALIHTFGISHWANTGSVGSNTGDRLAFNYGTNANPWNNTELLTIESGGNVGIGNTSPSSKLDVAGTIECTGLNLQNGSLDYGGGKQQSIDLAVGWYTFAVCKGRDATTSAQRAFGEFLINDVDSGRHGSCRLNATHFFGGGNSIQVFAYNFYSTAVFDELRIKESGTYAGAALQVYVSNANNNLESYMTMSEQNQSWELLDTWLADSDDSGHNAILGYASHSQDWSGFAASQRIDLSIFAVSQGGIYTTGGMYAEELELKDATGITIQTREDLDLTSAGGTDTSNQRHKRIFATTSNDGSPFDEMVYYSRGSTGGWSGQHTFTVDKSATSGTGYEALRIRDSGNGTSSEVLVSHVLGVGTTDPTFASGSGIHIKDATQANIRLEDDATEYFDIAMQQGNAYLINRVSDGFISLRTNSTERMKILSGGNVGIGIGTPVPKLHVFADNTTTNQTTSGAASITIEQDGTGDAALNFLLTAVRRWIVGIDNSDSDKFKISTGGTDIGTGTKLTIDSSGNTTVSGGLGAPSASITNQLTAGSTSVGSYQNVTTSDAITQNGVAINGTNTTNVRAEGNTFAFSTSHILAGNLTDGSEVELFRFNITNNSYRKFQAGRMFIRVQDTATSCFMQQSVTFGVTGTADVLQSTTDRLDSSIVSSASTAQQAWTDEKATIVVSLVSDYVCVKFKNDTGSTIGTSGFSARLSCELFEQDALPS